MPWSGGTVVVASEVQVIDAVSGRKLAITVDSSGIPGIHYTDPAASVGNSGDIYAGVSPSTGTINLIIAAGQYNGQSGVLNPMLRLDPGVIKLQFINPTQKQHGGGIALLEARAALEFYDPAPTSASALLNSVELNATNVLVKQPMIVTGETWHNASLIAPFTHAAGTPVQYRLKPDGDVELRGGALYGSAPAVGGYNMFTLPVGYRPTIQDEYAIARQGAYGAGKVVVDTAGLVSYWVNDGASNPQLGSVHFSTLT